MKSSEYSEIIVGIPSGQIIDLSKSDLKKLKQKGLVTFVAFSSDEEFDLDEITPVYENCFKDEDYSDIIKMLFDILMGYII